MEKAPIVAAAVGELYEAAATSMGAWMWRYHVQWVAERSVVLAETYGADAEHVYCAALLHDLGDSRFERGHEQFDAWSWETGKAILKTAGFRKPARDAIMEAVRTHSCHPGHLPTALEGKVLATADALWHLQTNFFPVLCFMNRPDGINDYDEWQQWFLRKITRDYEVKLFFDDEREAARDDYHALLRVFGEKPKDDALRSTV
jgi:hypothetical protein